MPAGQNTPLKDWWAPGRPAEISRRAGDRRPNSAAGKWRIYASSPGPYYNDIRFKLVINGERTVITITNFPAISTSFDDPLGTNTTVITRTGGGTES